MGRKFVGVVVAVVLAGTVLLAFDRPEPALAADCRPTGEPAGETDDSREPSDSSQAADLELSMAQLNVARKIVRTARSMDISKRGVVIALQTAKQESQLDAAVVVGRATGAFQQIAPGPGNAYVGYDRTDAAAAARGFFTVLLDRVPDYASDDRSNADIAQVVQASGAGARYYAPWKSFAERLARVLLDDDATMTCAVGSDGPVPVASNGVTVKLPGSSGLKGSVKAPTPKAARVIAAALSWLGTPYAWGGGTPAGPSHGIRDGGVADAHGDYNKVGFDCSGLMVHAFAQAAVSLPRTSRAQRAGGGRVLRWSDALPGDLVFYGSGGIGSIHHVAMFIGVVDGVPYMVEAPQSGDVVKVSRVRTGGDFRPEVVRPLPEGGSRG